MVVFFSYIQAQNEIKLYSGKAPGSESWTWHEGERKTSSSHVFYNVVEPGLLEFLPDSENVNGTAVIVCPGGGFRALAIEHEGIEVAKWLNSKGITAFVLKYRLLESDNGFPKRDANGKEQDIDQSGIIDLAVADGKMALEYVRKNAEKYHIDPEKIGMMGFSAGGTVTMGVGYTYNEASKPNFLAPIYAYTKPFDELDVPVDAPSIFICAATDDGLGFATNSSNLYNKWVEADKSAELHMYAKGGHGFGMKKKKSPVSTWIDRFEDWLVLKGFLNY